MDNWNADEVGKLISMVAFLVGAYTDNPGLVGASVVTFLVSWFSL